MVGGQMEERDVGAGEMHALWQSGTMKTFPSGSRPPEDVLPGERSGFRFAPADTPKFVVL